MAHLPIATQQALYRDLVTVQAVMRSGLSVGRNTTTAVYVRLWSAFCEQYQLDTFHHGRPDHIPWLQIFGVLVHNGQHSSSGNCIQSGTVVDALQFVSQTFTMVGNSYPRHIARTTPMDTQINRQI
jgi:hypothetical protein